MSIQFPVKADFNIGQGRRLPVLEATLMDGRGLVIPLNGVAQSVVFYMEPENSAEGVTPTVNGASCTILPDVTFTASGAVLTAAAHGMINGSPVMVKTTTTLPGGLDAYTLYYIVGATTNTFGLSTTPNGTAITTSSGGTGTQTVVRGRVKYAWASGDTNTKGNFWGNFVVSYADGTSLVVPSDDQHPYLFIRIGQKLG